MKKIIIIIVLLLLFPLLTFAVNVDQGAGGDTPSDQGTVSLTNPLGAGKTDVPTLLGTIINYAMGIIGSLALVMFIYGGATWMLSGGNQEMVGKGKQTLIWASIGIVIIFTAYALVRFVISAITNT